MENITNNNAAAGNMQAADAEAKKKNRRSKKKKTTTRPKLKPVAVSLRAEFGEDDDLESGLGYGDIMVVPPPTPRDKLQSDLHRLTEEINTHSKFTPEWFQVKAELAVVQVKLDEWNENTPTAAKNNQMDNKPVVTTNAAYQDFLKFISNEEESKLLTTSTSKSGEGIGGQQPLQQQKDPTKKKKKKKSSSRSKIRPKLTPQSVVEKEEEEEGDEEDGLGFNDILLKKKKQDNNNNNKPIVVVDVDEHTLLLDQVAAANVQECQEVVCRSNNVGEWIVGGVIGTLLFVLAFKFLLH